MTIHRLSPIGFWSYSRQDDEHSGGRLSQLRARLSSELQINYGRQRVQIFQDSAAIPYGADWDRVIHQSLDRSTFFIPILTPNFIQSEFCMRELEIFLQRERQLTARHAELAETRLVFPIAYIPIAGKEGRDEALVGALEQLQWLPFERLRHLDYDGALVREKLTEFATSICSVLDRRLATTPSEPPPPAPAVVSSGTPSRTEAIAEAAPPPAAEEATSPEVEEAAPAGALASLRRFLRPPTRKEEVTSHALGATAIAALIGTLLLVLLLDPTRDTRQTQAALFLMWSLGTFACSYLAACLSDPLGGASRWARGALHVLIAVGVGLAIGPLLLVPLLNGLENTGVPGRPFFETFTTIFAAVGGIFASVALVPVHAAAMVFSLRAPRFRRRAAAVAVAVLVATGLAVSFVLRAPKDIEADALPLLARKGFLQRSEGESLDTADVRDARKALGLSEGDTVDAALIDKLTAAPDRTGWVVAEDGSGDGADLEAVIRRALNAGTTGKLTRQSIVLKSGTYTLTAKESETQILSLVCDCTIALTGEAGAEKTIVQLKGDAIGLSLDDDVIEGVTLRQTETTTSSAVEFVYTAAGGGALRDVIVDARSTATAVTMEAAYAGTRVIERSTILNPDGAGVSISGTKPVDYQMDARHPPTRELPAAMLRESIVRSRETGVWVQGIADPLVQANEISGMTKGNAIYVSGDARGTYRDNRVHDLTDYTAISTADRVQAKVERNSIRRVKNGNCVSARGRSVLTLTRNDLAGCVTDNSWFGWVTDLATIKASGNTGLKRDDVLVEKRGRLIGL